MNETTPPPVPPRSPLVQRPDFTPTELGDDPTERAPITNVIGVTEATMRQPRRLMYQLRQPHAGKLIVSMLFVSLICSLAYGLVVGTFSGGTQLWAAPIKIVTGLMISALICLPSLYIFTCLSGSQARFMEMFGLLAGLLTLMTVLLIGFAPVAWIFSESTESTAWMGTLHLLFWCISTMFGLRFLHTGFALSHAKSKAGISTWTIVFILVAFQMTTALRPIVGKADTFLPTEKRFFLSHWFDCIDASGGSRR